MLQYIPQTDLYYYLLIDSRDWFSVNETDETEAFNLLDIGLASGFFGILANYRVNFLLVLINVEFMYLTILSDLITIDTIDAQISVLILISIIASESVIGLGLAVQLYQGWKTLDNRTYVILRD